MRRPGAARAARRAARGARGRALAASSGSSGGSLSELVSERLASSIPVKDGERYLEELLDALAREGVDEVLVIDSGSRDRSREIARAAGVELLRDRARASSATGAPATSARERTARRADLLPHPGRDARARAGSPPTARRSRSTSASAPPTARTCRAPDTSPMIARELTRVLRRLRARRGARPSSARATRRSSRTSTPATRAPAGRRSASATSPTPRTRRSAPTCSAAGWSKVYHPGAAVLHAHDYGAARVHAPLLRRVPRPAREHRSRRAVRRCSARRAHVARAVAADRRWMAEQGLGGRRAGALDGALDRPPRRPARVLGARLARRAAAGARCAAASRSRAATATRRRRARAGARRPRRSAPGRRADAPRLPPTTHVGASAPRRLRRRRARLARGPGAAARSGAGHGRARAAAPGDGDPPVQPRQRRAQHAVSDPHAPRAPRARLQRVAGTTYQQPHARRVAGGAARATSASSSRRSRGRCTRASTTGRAPTWRSRPAGRPCTPTLLLDQCRARAYVVNDHEPEFYATSTERVLAEDTYRHGLHCIAASPWLRDLLIERYGASADAFQLGVDHDTYQPRPVARRTRHRHLLRAPRDPAARGADRADGARGAPPPPARTCGSCCSATDEPLARAPSPTSTSACSRPRSCRGCTREATVGLCLSLTNFSLMPKEMLACGLPCVELAGVSAESIFGADGPLELAPLDPRAIADALERLLDDPELLGAPLARGHRVRRLPHLGARHRRGRSGAAPRAARARTDSRGGERRRRRAYPDPS